MAKIHADGHITDAGQDDTAEAPALAGDAPAPGSIAAGEAVATGELGVIRPSKRKTKEDQ